MRAPVTGRAGFGLVLFGSVLLAYSVPRLVPPPLVVLDMPFHSHQGVSRQAAIAETGSVTRAGNRLHLTQSALSHQLRDAEEQLGTALFERKSGKMTLTPAGERLLQTARTVLGELERVEAEIQKNGTVAKGLIRMSTQCHTVYHWLPPRLNFFQRQFPEVEVQLVIEATNKRSREETLVRRILAENARKGKRFVEKGSSGVGRGCGPKNG